MFSNFKDAFVRKPQFTSKPPLVVEEYLNADIPQNFSYKYAGDGMYYLDSIDGINLQSGKVLLPTEAVPLFEGIKPTIELYQEYSYNSQKPIEILPNDDGCYIINNQKISAQKIVKNPLSPLILNESRFVMSPPSFPEPFSIKISGDGYELDLKMQRKPMNSIYKRLFETT